LGAPAWGQSGNSMVEPLEMKYLPLQQTTLVFTSFHISRSMALISAFTVIRALSLLHITLAFYFLTNPRMIADQNLVYLLGEAMQLVQPILPFPCSIYLLTLDMQVHVPDFNKPSPATAFLAVIFAFLGISDLTSVSMAEPLAVEYWSSMTPIRLIFLFPLTAYTYWAKPDGLAAVKSKYYKASPGIHLQNGMIFTWAFLELVLWFWVSTLCLFQLHIF
jgi:hypothetical protein